MRLSRLRCEGFRNLRGVNLHLPAGFISFSGENGQGKTNVLEAINLLLTLKSLRDATNSQMLGHECKEARVEGLVGRGVLERDYDLVLRKGGRSLRLDGKTPSRLKDWFSPVAAVVFTPDDLRILDGSAAIRRRFADRAAFTLDPATLPDVLALGQAWNQRNALLRTASRAGIRPDEPTLDVFDEGFAESAAAVVERRIELMRNLAPALREVHEGVTALRKGRIEIRYRPCCGPEIEGRSNIRLAILERLRAARPLDIERGTTTVGPHREDWDLKVGGESLRNFGSQGQLRAAALALKIALVRVVQEKRGFSPIFLLDDHSSELDAGRRLGLVAVLRALGAQTFVTSTDPSTLDGETVARFHVEQGEVRPI